MSFHARRNAFVGRDSEARRLADLVAQKGSCVVVRGAPGIGKSRLVEQTLAAERKHVLWVECSDLNTIESFARRVASQISLPSEELAALAIQCEERWKVLVLDNADALLPVIENLLKVFFEETSRLSIVITARKPTHFVDEVVLTLESLTHPSESNFEATERSALSESEELFIARVRQLKPEFDPSVEERQSIARLCAQAQGNPAILEISASQIGALDVDALREQLESDPASVVKKPSRWSTLPVSFDASLDNAWNTLSPTHQDALAKLSIFSAEGFALVDAKYLLGDEAEKMLTDLIDASFVWTRDSERKDSQFGLHNPTRTVAKKHLSEGHDSQKKLLSAYAHEFLVHELFLSPISTTPHFVSRARCIYSTLTEEVGRAIQDFKARSTPEQLEIAICATILCALERMHGGGHEGQRLLHSLEGLIPKDLPGAWAPLAIGMSPLAVYFDPALALDWLERGKEKLRALPPGSSLSSIEQKIHKYFSFNHWLYYAAYGSILRHGSGKQSDMAATLSRAGKIAEDNEEWEVAAALYAYAFMGYPVDAQSDDSEALALGLASERSVLRAGLPNLALLTYAQGRYFVRKGERTKAAQLMAEASKGFAELLCPLYAGIAHFFSLTYALPPDQELPFSLIEPQLHRLERSGYPLLASSAWLAVAAPMFGNEKWKEAKQAIERSLSIAIRQKFEPGPTAIRLALLALTEMRWQGTDAGYAKSALATAEAQNSFYVDLVKAILDINDLDVDMSRLQNQIAHFAREIDEVEPWATALLKLLEKRNECLVAHDGSWFEIARQKTLVKSANHQATLLALAHASQNAIALSANDLWRAIWPGEEPLNEDQLENRVRVTVHGLRKLGLKEYVTTELGGYRLKSYRMLDAPDSQTS